MKRGNVIIVLLAAALLMVLGSACSNARGPAPTTEVSNTSPAARTAPPTQASVPQNGPEYWVECCSDDLYEESYEEFVPETDAEAAELVEMAKDSEQQFLAEDLKDVNTGDVEYAFTFYTRAAMRDRRYIDHAVTNLERGIKYKADATSLAENTLSLISKYPELKEPNKFLLQIQNLILQDLKEDQYFDVNKSYADPASWGDVYGTGVYAIRDIDFLSRIAKKTGDRKAYAKWQRYIAEYELTGHTFDGVHSDNTPTISYNIYTKLGDKTAAKKAAILVGEKYLDVYLSGAHNILGHLVRSPRLAYDLDQAKAWFSKGGLNEQQTTEAIQAAARKALEDLPDCTTRKECATEDWDSVVFLKEVLSA